MPFSLSAQEVAHGLLHQEFKLYVQPQFDLASGTVFAVEALARWHHPIHGVLPPGLFIPMLEKYRWMDELFFQLFEEGLLCQWQLHEQGFPLGFSFNLSPSQWVDTTFVARLQQRLQRHPLPASTLTLEITEGALLENPADFVAQFTRLSLLGLRLSMDDYGTGHSSLLRLCQFPFDEIKLAGELIQSLEQNHQQQGIVDSTLYLAKRLGLELIVEGIETPQQCQWLLNHGVHQGQGYLCAKPMPAEALKSWIKAPYQSSAPTMKTDFSPTKTDSEPKARESKKQMRSWQQLPSFGRS